MNQLSNSEVEACTTATMLIDLDRQAKETGMNQVLYVGMDEIRQRDSPLINDSGGKPVKTTR